MGNEFYERYLQSEGWLKRRERELARAKDCCEFCGAPGELDALQVHHLTYAHLGQELPGELIVLCHGCHKDVHDHPKIDVAVRQLAAAAGEQEQRALADKESGMRAARAILDSLERRSGLGSPQLPEGYCMDCKRDSPWRWILANERCCLALCRSCRASRKAAAVRLGIDVEEAQPDDWETADEDEWATV